VVGCTTGSIGEVPGERKPVIRDDDDDDQQKITVNCKGKGKVIHVL
jgi:hypothetical protein